MAQTGFTPLLIYSSSTATNAPTAGNLLNNATGSELAINIADGKLFYKDSSNAVQVIGWKIRPATAGGTGLTSFAVGDLIYADTTTTLAKLADVATGNALISGGVGVAPSYGKIGLTTHVSGTLPIANGGTNSTATPTAGGIGYGTGTANAYTAVGTTGQVLTSAGAGVPTWTTPTTGTVTSVAATVPAFLSISGSPITGSGTLAISYSGTALPVANGGTGLTSSGASGSYLASNGTSWVAKTPPAFIAVGNAFVTASNATATKIAYAVSSYDSNSNYSTANSRFTPNVAGYYQINAQIQCAGSAIGAIAIFIYVNGSLVVQGNYIPLSTIGPCVQVNAIIHLNGSTDYVEIYGYQSSGGNLSIGANASPITFSGALVRAD